VDKPIKKVMQTWESMMLELTRMSEAELEKALMYELKNEKRRSVIIRLHRRFTRIRKERELKEYLSDATGA
jgi:hypothetical protein